MRAIRHTLSWLLAIFLIAVFLHWTVHPWPEPVPGQVIFFDLPGDHDLFARLAEGTGVSLFEPTGRVVLGIAELLCALLLLVSPWRKAGARLASVCLLLLIAAHLSPWGGIELSGAGEDGTDAGASFYLTVAALTASFLLLYVHPERR